MFIDAEETTCSLGHENYNTEWQWMLARTDGKIIEKEPASYSCDIVQLAGSIVKKVNVVNFDKISVGDILGVSSESDTGKVRLFN